jgi:hypothetical protein
MIDRFYSGREESTWLGHGQQESRDYIIGAILILARR